MKIRVGASLLFAVTLLLTAGIITWRSEAVIEKVLLDRTKYDVTMFLAGIESKASAAGGLLDANSMQIAMSDTLRDDAKGLSFTIKQLYAYNETGEVYAWIGDKEKPRPMDGHYGDVIRQDISYFGDEVEEETNRITGVTEYFTDIIIPLHQDGKVVGGLEAEINLGQTMKQIKMLYKNYEMEVLIVALSLLAVSLLLLWFILRQPKLNHGK